MRRLLAIAILLTACGTGGDSKTVTVTASDFGADWPLTVDHGQLECQSPGSVLFTDPDGIVYALNGTAKDHTDGADVMPIWANSDYGLKVSIGPLIDRGLDLC